MAKKTLSIDERLEGLKPSGTTKVEQPNVAAYWFGLTMDCPVERKDLGPLSLVKQHVVRKGSPSGHTDEFNYQGFVALLTDQQIERFLDLLEYAYIRPEAINREGLDETNKTIPGNHRYIVRCFHPSAKVLKGMEDAPTEDDIPLMNYVYLQKRPDKKVKQVPLGTETPTPLGVADESLI